MQVCVVGAGIFGMAAALELRERGHEVLLLERGQIPNPEASSTDVPKVIRRTSYWNETYVELVTRAAAHWREWHDSLDLLPDGPADRGARLRAGARGAGRLGDLEPVGH